jgi:uncharacterized protein (DUF1330 family)
MDKNLLRTLDEVEPKDLDSTPIIVLNLLKFKSEEATKKYLDYGAEFFRTFGARGAEIIYAGSFKERFQGDIGDWDAMLLARYPNRRMFYEMHRSEEYLAFSHLREDALEDGVLWASEALLPYRTQSIEFEGGDWLGELNSRLSG